MDRRVEKMRQAYGLMLEGPRNEKIEAAWAEVEQAEADLAKAKWRLDNCTVRAPRDGIVVYANTSNGWGQQTDQIREGATVREGQAIVNLPDPRKMTPQS